MESWVLVIVAIREVNQWIKGLSVFQKKKEKKYDSAFLLLDLKRGWGACA